MSEERKYTGFAAIYQIEQEKLKREKAQPPQMPSDEPEGSAAGESSPAGPPAEELRETHNASPPVGPGEESNWQAGATSTREASPAVLTGAGEDRAVQTTPSASRGPRRGAAAAAKPRPVSAPSTGEADAGVEAHAARWKQVYRLNKGEIKVMSVMFRLSYGRGTDVCFIKVGEVADAAQLKKRRCQYVIRSLETLGFLDRLGEYDPSNRLGIQYLVRLNPARIESK
ncbi:MAG: hypothetical protein QOH49_4263 [Acidobacteriota bacterium]|nr:hypothetical protein [Acidobacteriota bacterium]